MFMVEVNQAKKNMMIASMISVVILLIISSVTSEEAVYRGENADNVDNNNYRKLTRDDFVFNEPNNASLYFDLSSLTPENDKTNSTQSTGRSSRALDLDHYLGGPRKSRREGNRESRILNDETPAMAIQGFIPIVSLANNQGNSGNNPSRGSSNEYSNSNNEEGDLSNHQQGYAGPNDAKFLGAALQGLTSAFKQKQHHQHHQQNYGPIKDCICVPFYMCKNGFLAQRQKNPSLSESILGNANNYEEVLPNSNSYDELIHAQSMLNQYNIPAKLSSLYGQDVTQKAAQSASYSAQESQAQNSYQLPDKLAIDERSIDGGRHNFENLKNQENETAPQYASEVLGRIFGSSSSNSHNCGVLRTCCRIAQPEVNSFEFASQFEGQHSPMPGAGQRLPENIGYQPIQSIPNYRPYSPKRYQPSIDVTASLIRPKPLTYNGYSPFNGGQSPNRIGHPNQPLPGRPNIPLHQALPVRQQQQLKPLPSSHHGQLVNPYSSSVNGDPSLGSCGMRHAVGIHGRVQNLQYHKASAEFGEYPWQVAILKRLGPADSLYVCGGTLISSQWIATAAHCIKTNGPQDLKARLGEWDVHRDDEFYPHSERFIDEIIIHPEYYPGNLINDIALMRLSAPVDFTSPHIMPACLPTPYDNFAGHRCWVTGWGKDAFGTQGEYQSVLKEVDVPVMNNRECEQILKQTRLGPYYQLHPGFLCAGGEPGKDACEGDGGSPLVCDINGVWKVAGLVSWGIGCGAPGVPGVYVNMGQYSGWIESIIGRYAKNAVNGNQIDNYPPANVIVERSNGNAYNATVIEGLSKEQVNSTEIPLNTTVSSS